MSDKFDATIGIMPNDSESPIQRTFFFVVDIGRGGPDLQTLAAVELALPSAGTHVKVSPYPPPLACTQVFPAGQHVKPGCLPQQVAPEPSGQQPTSLGLKPEPQQVDEDGQEVVFQGL